MCAAQLAPLPPVSRSRLPTAILLFGVALAGGCATAPARPPAQPAAESVPAAAPPDTQVFVYPTGGQTAMQLDRDRYECHMWAVRQTGFDPSEPQLAPHQRVQIVAMPPAGTSTLAGAATGAVIGAAVSAPYDTGSGAAIGAVAGAVLGAAADSARQQQAGQIQRGYDEQGARLQARLEQRAGSYRRAIGACLEGRGYTVK